MEFSDLVAAHNKHTTMVNNLPVPGGDSSPSFVRRKKGEQNDIHTTYYFSEFECLRKELNLSKDPVWILEPKYK